MQRSIPSSHILLFNAHVDILSIVSVAISISKIFKQVHIVPVVISQFSPRHEKHPTHVHRELQNEGAQPKIGGWKGDEHSSVEYRESSDLGKLAGINYLD